MFTSFLYFLFSALFSVLTTISSMTTHIKLQNTTNNKVTQQKSTSSTTSSTSITQKENIAIVNKVSKSEMTSDIIPTARWGQTDKIADHTYRTYVADDSHMSTESELFEALNDYRIDHGVQKLFLSDSLCRLADMRINQLAQLGSLDAHKGLNEYLADEKNWQNFPRFDSIGENNSYGYKLSSTHLIEWVFDADEEHRSNQQNPRWNRACIRIHDTIVEMIFGEEK
jgi:uncharacterized protein YkwD